MSVTLANSSTLIPTPPDWNDAVEYKRRWESGVISAVNGSENRAALRQTALRELHWTVNPFTLNARLRLNDRLMDAVNRGRACAPVWPRGRPLSYAVLSSNSGSTAWDDRVTAKIDGSKWPWTTNDYIFLWDPSDPESFEARAITSASEAAGVWTLGWADAVTRDYAAGLLAWPMIFGTPRVDTLSVLTNHHGSVRLGILEPLGSGDIGAASCPVEECPEFVFGGPDYDPGLAAACSSPYSESVIASDYVWGFNAGQNPNELMTAEQLEDYRTLFDNEYTNATSGMTIAQTTAVYWLYSYTTSTQNSALSKIAVSTDPTDGLGDVSVLYNGFWRAARKICAQ